MQYYTMGLACRMNLLGRIPGQYWKQSPGTREAPQKRRHPVKRRQGTRVGWRRRHGP